MTVISYSVPSDETSGTLLIPAIYEDASDKDLTVLYAMILEKITRYFVHDTMIFGIDPGKLTGLSIFYRGHEIETSFHTSIDELVIPHG